MLIQDFEWDEQKNEQNQKKHGISFTEAVLAFYDDRRIIERDNDHSQTEERFFCYAMIGGRILTVRFTYRAKKVRIIGAACWRKGRKIYVTQSTH